MFFGIQNQGYFYRGRVFPKFPELAQNVFIDSVMPRFELYYGTTEKLRKVIQEQGFLSSRLKVYFAIADVVDKMFCREDYMLLYQDGDFDLEQVKAWRKVPWVETRMSPESDDSDEPPCQFGLYD